MRQASSLNWSLAYLISEWAIRLVMLVYVPQRRSAAASRTWLLLIFLLPWPGLVLYAGFRTHLRFQDAASALQLHARPIRSAFRAGPNPAASQRFFTRATPNCRPNSAAIACRSPARLGDFEPFGGNQIELLTDYDAAD